MNLFVLFLRTCIVLIGLAWGRINSANGYVVTIVMLNHLHTRTIKEHSAHIRQGFSQGYFTERYSNFEQS